MKILDALASHGANLDCYVGEDKETPLHKSASSGNDDMVQWLLKNGAKPNLRHPRSGASAMMMAAKYSFPECVAQLIKYDAKIDMQDVSCRAIKNKMWWLDVPSIPCAIHIGCYTDYSANAVSLSVLHVGRCVDSTKDAQLYTTLLMLVRPKCVNFCFALALIVTSRIM